MLAHELKQMVRELGLSWRPGGTEKKAPVPRKARTRRNQKRRAKNRMARLSRRQNRGKA